MNQLVGQVQSIDMVLGHPGGLDPPDIERSMTRSAGRELRADVKDEIARLRGPGFGVEFRKIGDRWSHAVFGHGAEIAWAQAISVREGSEDPARVVSPVYQEVQLHGAETGPALCLLLTGLFFKHHFSAAVTLALDPAHSGRLLLDLDVADRCRSTIENLAATYLVGLDSGAIAAADPARIAWRLDTEDPGLLELVAMPPATLVIAEAGRQATRVQVLASIQAGTFTHRLRYGWRWTSDAGLTR